MAPISDAPVTAEAQLAPVEPSIMGTTLAGKATCIFLALAVLWILFGIGGCAFAQLVSGDYSIGDAIATIFGLVALLGFFVFLIHTLTLKIEIGTDYISTKSALFACKYIQKSDISLARHANGRSEWILIWEKYPPNKKKLLSNMSIPISFLSKENALKIIEFVREPLAQQVKIDEVKAERDGIAIATGYLAVLYLIFFAALGYAIYKYYLPAATP